MYSESAILAGDIMALDEVGLPASTNCVGPSERLPRSFDLSYDKRDQLHRAINTALIQYARRPDHAVSFIERNQIKK